MILSIKYNHSEWPLKLIRRRYSKIVTWNIQNASQILILSNKIYSLNTQTSNGASASKIFITEFSQYTLDFHCCIFLERAYACSVWVRWKILISYERSQYFVDYYYFICCWHVHCNLLDALYLLYTRSIFQKRKKQTNKCNLIQG